jgi:hypothetical protein
VTHRTVRVTTDFFTDLDAQLPDERGPRGEPTRAEFAASDLLEIVDAFAELWDQLPEAFPGRPGYRDLILTTRLVPYVWVRGQSAPDGAIELITIRLDLVGLPGDLDDRDALED